MTQQQTHVIVGASLAGAKAAETLRSEGYDGRVVLVGTELHRPYERPALSKGFLTGKTGEPELYVHDEAFYVDHGIELRLGTTATALDPGGHTVTLDDTEVLHYDRLLLATGCEPRVLGVPGAHLAGIHLLRTVDDAMRLRVAAESASAVAVVGAGRIGCEVAASLRTLGQAVTVIDPGELPLLRVLGREVATVYRDLHAAHGVELRLGTGVAELRGTGAVEELVTTTGNVIAADLVVVGIGVVPRTELATHAGLAVDNGVLVDGCLHTSAPDIFAAGDIANAVHPLLGTRLRVEHWANALNQGVAAARNMLRAATAYDRLPYFYSDQYDLGMEYSGHADMSDEVVFRGDPASGEFLAFWRRGGRVVAGMNANVWDVNDDVQALIRAQRPVSSEALADPSVSLDQLLEPQPERV